MERLGQGFADWCERWFPDPITIALGGVLLIFLAGICVGARASDLARSAGDSFWALGPFTVQMAMTIIGGYAVASASPVSKLIDRMARIPRTGKGAIAYIAFFSMTTALLSWGFSLIFSGLLVRRLAARLPDMDYRAAGAASYLGLGPIWALGLSSSSALMMATKSSIPPRLLAISGVIPLGETLFTFPTLITAAVLIVVGVGTAFLSAPSQGRAKSALALRVPESEPASASASASQPGERLDQNPLFTVGVVAILVCYLWQHFGASLAGVPSNLDLSNYNIVLFTVGMLLHWRPASFLKAVSQSIPATAGVLIQFPLYAMIYGMIVGSPISEGLAHIFVSATTPQTYPILVAVYSSTLGVFVPSAGGKWVIEAPYILEAARHHHLALGWIVQVYNASEALPNMINPFWMLPLLSILRLRARSIVGYSALQLIVQAPITLFLCWVFTRVIG